MAFCCFMWSKIEKKNTDFYYTVNGKKGLSDDFERDRY